jgi:signal peptidase I
MRLPSPNTMLLFRNVVIGLMGYDVLSERVGFVSQVQGPSMLPTFNSSGDFVLVRRWGLLDDLQVGSLVVSVSPYDADRLVIKRVVAVAGDILPNYQVVPQGHVFLQGDNPGMSMDSRHYGPVPIGLVQGIVAYRIWPPNRLGRV